MHHKKTELEDGTIEHEIKIALWELFAFVAWIMIIGLLLMH